MDGKRVQVWSCGGGTQSAAIAALICRGEIKPDLSVIVDTERDVQQTWDYYDNILVPNLANVGVILNRVKKSEFATVDLYGGIDKNTLLIPAFTAMCEAFPMLQYCKQIVAIGRLSWEGNGAQGVNNCAWYLFDRSAKQTVFHGKSERAKKGAGNEQH